MVLNLSQLSIIAAIAFATSVVGGMVGIGGAVLLIPAFLVIPPLLGVPPLDMYRVSGITSVQVLASSVFGAHFTASAAPSTVGSCSQSAFRSCLLRLSVRNYRAP